MSSEREKLIEVWLDNANERQYQFAFRNALISAGYTILHNTSHTALELGKDIIALSPEGELFAYQLKGNPGGRITISQWQDLIAQINTLVYQPITSPALSKSKPHTPVLVTNGEIHEDVAAAITLFNSAIVGPNARPLQTIARGQLLQQILQTAATIWPTDVPTQRRLLNMLVASGDDELPLDEFAKIIDAVLGQERYSSDAIPSIHLVLSIISSSWIAKGNYYELVKMYVIATVAIAAFQERWNRRSARDVRHIDEVSFDTRSHLEQVILDLFNNYNDKPLVNEHIFWEFGYFHARKKMISGLLSAALLYEELKLSVELRDFVRNFVCKTKHSHFLVWEGIVPYCLAEIWALSNVQGTNEPDRRLFQLLQGILFCNDSELPINRLPAPYYELHDVVSWKFGPYLQNTQSPLNRDSFYRRSWFAEPLFQMLVRRNYKKSCKSFWSELTKFIHARTRLPSAVEYSQRTCQAAVAEDMVIPTPQPKRWEEAVQDASRITTPLIPSSLKQRPAIVLMYSLFVPYRMDRDIILWLDRVYSTTWY